MSMILDITSVLGKMGCKSSDKPRQKQKLKHRKGLWSPEEDQRLRNHVLKHGHGCWSSVPINAGKFSSTHHSPISCIANQHAILLLHFNLSKKQILS
ncbi:MYB DOMAIN PROTEIN 55 [Salix viminalis]|uniref:MYB DOMAIN PROTEIN 55 n=1 Tax=Salix viminalis TaxID=40686 RepID=A0A9Q0NLT0_SALVM|nr:MYB DOMAIN PROTEIN 55 [Salix viminalis]